jgi:hypothetical protein
MKVRFKLISVVLALLLCAYIPFQALANPQLSGDTVSSALWWPVVVYNQVQQIKDRDIKAVSGAILFPRLWAILWVMCLNYYFKFLRCGLDVCSLSLTTAIKFFCRED